ncbi:MAG TPA: serine hydrolase domain-containing protein [Vicinamibacterales bacterium]|jgi:CubicO group peptidase (beta-lactamase class C family)|nr:serine hydrolase domain-containing protein [Vicinamibacterales bacterium]
MFHAARQLLDQATSERAFPAAVIEVGTTGQMLWREAFGRLTYADDAPRTTDDTIFDLASLTKVISTTPLVMQQLERGVLALDDLVSGHVAEWRHEDRSGVTLRDLLAHCSGLPAWRPYYKQLDGREMYERAISAEPLEYAPRTRSIYSDLDFILLGFIVHGRMALTERFALMLSQMGIVEELQFNPPQLWRARTAPTEFDQWRGRLLVGEVHDENAAALGGIAGHAGLFGTAASVGAYARHLMQVLDGRSGVFRRTTLEEFVSKRADIPGSSRALGWDTMLPTSSCGTKMSARAFGHTGFTGTSLWIDAEKDVYVVLLTNRVHPTRSNEAIKRIRPAVHDSVISELR